MDGDFVSHSAALLWEECEGSAGDGGAEGGTKKPVQQGPVKD